MTGGTPLGFDVGAKGAGGTLDGLDLVPLPLLGPQPLITCFTGSLWSPSLLSRFSPSGQHSEHHETLQLTCLWGWRAVRNFRCIVSLGCVFWEGGYAENNACRGRFGGGAKSFASSEIERHLKLPCFA